MTLVGMVVECAERKSRILALSKDCSITSSNMLAIYQYRFPRPCLCDVVGDRRPCRYDKQRGTSIRGWWGLRRGTRVGCAPRKRIRSRVGMHQMRRTEVSTMDSNIYITVVHAVSLYGLRGTYGVVRMRMVGLGMFTFLFQDDIMSGRGILR